MIHSVVSTAGYDADKNGFGVNEMQKSDRSWVLLKFAMELDFRPGMHQQVNIETWIYDIHRVLTTRNFTLRDDGGNIFGWAISQWCMIDLKRRRAIDLSSMASDFAPYIIDDRSPLSPPKRLGALSSEAVAEMRVSYSGIDFNGHFNAIRYIEFMLDQLPLSIIENSCGLRVDLNFISECYYGEQLSVKYEQKGDISLFEIRKGDGSTAVRGAFEWR